MRFITVLSVVLFLLFTELSAAVELETSKPSQTESYDIYDAINILVDSLRVWAVDSVIVSEAWQTNIEQDSMQLSELFPYYKISINDSSNLITIDLPPYMNILTTVLQLNKHKNNILIKHPFWHVPVSYDGENLSVDNIPIPLSGQVRPDSAIINHIHNRIALLRTIGLPPHLICRYSSQDTSHITVTVRGREIINIPFTFIAWLRSLNRLSAGMQIYAGLLNVNVDSSSAMFNYYILIKHPNIRGHHFLEWRESLIRINNNWQSSMINIIFSPYIRTDNLKDLFASPKNSGREQIEIKIK